MTKILTAVTWDVEFPDDESYREFQRYAANWKREFSKYGPFQPVKIQTPRGQLNMLGWQYREYLYKQLQETIDSLGGFGDTDPEEEIITDPQPMAPQIAPQMDRRQAPAQGNQQEIAAQQAAAQQANKRIAEAFKEVGQ